MSDHTIASISDTPEERLAHAFAGQLQRWSLAAGASVQDASAAAQAGNSLSLACAAGHVCLRLSALPASTGGANSVAQWRSSLLASGVVAPDSAPASAPLILDAQDRLYLHRYFDYERRLAQRLIQARQNSAPVSDVAVLRQRLDALFPDVSRDIAVNWQKLAAALALRGHLLIVSGGPGTGKTTTVVNLLACLLAQDASCRIALAAPTGKAAARMTEAIRAQATTLPAALQCLLPGEAFTVHRLLGARPDGNFRHHAGKPLAIDALVLDEASMLDLALATRLLEAVPDGARIILLGDKDQLSAVESGAVFAELGMDTGLSLACRQDLADLSGTPLAAIIPPDAIAPSALQDCVVWLTHNFRFAAGSGIGRLAGHINAGDAHAAIAMLRQADDPALAWIDALPEGAAEPTDAALLARMEQGYAAFLTCVGDNPTRFDAAAVAAVHQAFLRFRTLCAVRETPRGVHALNAAFTAYWLERRGTHAATGPWFVGRPVQILRNDYAQRLFNGDIGIALPDENGDLQVHFALADGSYRAISPWRLPPHETAFAMTVHKAQGSEFDQVLVVLPAQRSRVLTRELLYTAVTRARTQVTVCASTALLQVCIGTTMERHSGLLARLHAAATDSRNSAS